MKIEFFFHFWKENVKKTRAETETLENKLKELEQNPDCIFDYNYFDYQNKLEQIYEGKSTGVKIGRKCEWWVWRKIFKVLP